MKEYKDNFKNAINFAVHKLENPAFKMILLGIMGSIYVGIAYLVFILILGSWPGAVTPETFENGIIKTTFSVHITGPALFAAASLFPVGIIMILFLGGSLFTSDNLTMLAWITKQRDKNGEYVKLRRLFIRWGWTLLGNIIGGLIMGGVTRASSFFGSENYQYMLGYICGKKITMEWYYVIFSGFLCNILVAGSVWATFATKHSSAKIFLVYFPIWLFAVSGFQHVVANGIVFSMGLFYLIHPNEQLNVLAGINYAVNHDLFKPGVSISQVMSSGEWVNSGEFAFRLFIMNLMPAAVGNWLSGSIFLPYTYYYLSGHKKEIENNIHNVL